MQESLQNYFYRKSLFGGVGGKISVNLVVELSLPKKVHSVYLSRIELRVIFFPVLVI